MSTTKKKTTEAARTKVKKQKFLKAYASYDGNIKAACEAAGGISRNTVYLWMKDESFQQEMDNAIEDLHDFVESKFMEKIRKGYYPAIKDYAFSKMKHRGYIFRQEHTGKDGDQLPAPIIQLNYGSPDTEEAKPTLSAVS